MSWPAWDNCLHTNTTTMNMSTQSSMLLNTVGNPLAKNHVLARNSLGVVMKCCNVLYMCHIPSNPKMSPWSMCDGKNQPIFSFCYGSREMHTQNKCYPCCCCPGTQSKRPDGVTQILGVCIRETEKCGGRSTNKRNLASLAALLGMQSHSRIQIFTTQKLLLLCTKLKSPTEILCRTFLPIILT